MRFDSGPEVFVRVNRNYVLTQYVLNENDCNSFVIIIKYMLKDGQWLEANIKASFKRV